MNKFNQARSQGGFSLIELLLVLAIVAALAVAAFIVYPRVQAGRNASYESQVLSSAQAGVKALFTTNNYARLTTPVAVDAEIFPSNMKVGATIENQWAGVVTAGPALATGADGPATGVARYFKFVYPNVPTDVCIRLAGAAVQNFGTVLVGTEVVQDLYTGAAAGALDEAKITTGCKGETATPGRATITFVSN